MHTRSRFSTAVAGAVLGVAVLGGAPALAAWSQSGTGAGAARATSLVTPTNVSATGASNTTMTITWSAANQLSGATYQVVRNGSTTLSCTTSPCTDSGLTAGTTYSYVVSSRIGTSWSKSAASVNGTTTNVNTDTTAPTLGTPSVSGTAGTGTWYRSTPAPTVTLTATDNAGGSGLDRIEYQIGGTSGAWSTYINPIPVPESASYVIWYRASDKAGNTSSAASTTVKYDGTGAAISGIKPANGSQFNGNNWNTSNLCSVGATPAVCATVTDALSGLGSTAVTYQLTYVSGTNTMCWNGSQFVSTACSAQPMSLSSNNQWVANSGISASSVQTGTTRNYTLTVSATDQAGNVASVAAAFSAR